DRIGGAGRHSGAREGLWMPGTQDRQSSARRYVRVARAAPARVARDPHGSPCVERSPLHAATFPARRDLLRRRVDFSRVDSGYGGFAAFYDLPRFPRRDSDYVFGRRAAGIALRLRHLLDVGACCERVGGDLQTVGRRSPLTPPLLN